MIADATPRLVTRSWWRRLLGLPAKTVPHFCEACGAKVVLYEKTWNIRFDPQTGDRLCDAKMVWICQTLIDLPESILGYDQHYGESHNPFGYDLAGY